MSVPDEREAREHRGPHASVLMKEKRECIEALARPCLMKEKRENIEALAHPCLMKEKRENK